MPNFRVSDRTIENVLRGNFEEEEEQDELGKILGLGPDDSQDSQSASVPKSSKSSKAVVFPTPKHSPAVFSDTENSPALTYTPGKSRLDAASMARLKAKYGSGSDDSQNHVEIKSLGKDIIFSVSKTSGLDAGMKRKESLTPRVALTNIAPQNITDASVPSPVQLPVSEPANRIEPSPTQGSNLPDRKPAMKVSKKSSNGSTRYPVRFLDDPVASAPTPAQTSHLSREYSTISPSDTASITTYHTKQAGRTPKLRQALVPPPSDEKVADDTTIAANAGAARLWTAADFASVNNSPDSEYNISSRSQNVTYSPMESMQGSSDMSPDVPSKDSEGMQSTPENVRQFRQMAQEITAGITSESRYHVSQATLFAESPEAQDSPKSIGFDPQSNIICDLDRATPAAAAMIPQEVPVVLTQSSITDASPNHMSVASKRAVNHSILSDSRISPLPRRGGRDVVNSYKVDDSHLSNMFQQNLTESSIELDPTPLPKYIEKVNQIKRPQPLRVMETGRPVVVSTPVVLPQRSYVQQQNSSFAQSESDVSIDYAGVSFGRPLSRGRHERRSVSASAATTMITTSVFMKSTKINSPLKVPQAVEPLQHSVVPTVTIVRPSSIPGNTIDTSRVASGIKSGCSRIPTDENFVDIRPEDYEEEVSEEDDEEIFQYISEGESSLDEDINNVKEISARNMSASSVHQSYGVKPELLMTAKKPKGSAVTSIATQCTPGVASAELLLTAKKPKGSAVTSIATQYISNLASETYTSSKAIFTAGHSHSFEPLRRPVMDIRDVNFEVSDDSSDDEGIFDPKGFTPKSLGLRERLDESGEFGLEELLMSAKSRESVTSTLTKTAASAMTDRSHYVSRFMMEGSTPQRLRSGARRVQSDFEEEDSMDYNKVVTTDWYADEAEETNVIAASETDMNNSAMFTAATTLSLDSDEGDVNFDEGEVPRIAITRRQRSFKDSSDVKEIVVAGAVGVETTIVLTFANRKSQEQKLYAKTVQMRFDSNNALVPKTVTKSPKLTPGGNNLTASAFDVHPRCVRMEPNSDSTLYVSFLPTHSGIYGGVLKIRTNKKSFVILLRGEASLETPIKAKANKSIIFDETTEKSIVKSTTVNTEKSPMKRPVEVIEKSPEKVAVANLENSKKSNESVLVSQCDPLVMRQKWLREWLNRATQRQSAVVSMAPAISNIARHTGALPKRSQSVPNHSQSNSACLSVIPSSLRLLPQRKSEMGKYGEYFINTGLLQGALLVRNFSQYSLEIGIATSSENIMVRTTEYVVPAYDAVSVPIEFDPSIVLQKVPTMSPNDSQGGLVGYVMISSSVGEEFVVDVKMPPQSCLSPNVGVASRAGDELRANCSLREFVNADTIPLFRSCVNAFQNSIVNHNADLSSVTESVKEKPPILDSSPQDTKLLQRKRERALARGREILAQYEDNMDATGIKVSESAAKASVDVGDHKQFSTLLNVTSKSVFGESTVMATSKKETDVTPRKVMSPLRYPKSYKKLETSPKPQSPRSPRRLNRSISYASHEDLISERERAVTNGVFFRKLLVDFGNQEMGSLTRQKIDMCNSTNEDVVVLVTDPALPFVTLHNEIHLKANSYVRLPIRFVPVSKSTFEVDLIGTVKSSGEKIRIVLSGQCV